MPFRKMILIFLFLSFLSPAYSQSPCEEYLCKLGIQYFKMGRYDLSLVEFNKVIVINPNNPIAKEYVERISKLSEKCVTEALDMIEQKRIEKPFPIKGRWKIKGDSQLSLEFIGQDLIWKRENFDLNEENWRILSDKAYNLRENTYDPAISSQIKFDLDYVEEDFSFHIKIDILPYSFIGKSQKITIDSGGALSYLAEIELKYWANTGISGHSYIYASNNPVNIKDPLGLWDWGSGQASPGTSRISDKCYCIKDLSAYNFVPIANATCDKSQSGCLPADLKSCMKERCEKNFKIDCKECSYCGDTPLWATPPLNSLFGSKINICSAATGCDAGGSPSQRIEITMFHEMIHTRRFCQDPVIFGKPRICTTTYDCEISCYGNGANSWAILQGANKYCKPTFMIIYSKKLESEQRIT